ncbi:MAG TPA: hypothetical protein VM283_07580 [Armatimonadota bacterium]|nr:hypothetical protein [Armatimonadota bacterium]
MGRLPALIAVALTCISARAELVVNDGFEQVGDDGAPTGWATRGPQRWQLTPDAARSGERGLRLLPCGEDLWLRQEIKDPGRGPWTVAGWFRGVGLEVDGDAKQAVRFYVHVLYRDRPYADTMHVYRDLPTGDWDWRRVALRVTPRTEWPVEQIWVTAFGRFGAGELWADDISVEEAQPMGGVTASDWEREDEAVVISDMTQCRPVDALSDARERGKWTVFDYEIGPHTGKLVSAAPEAEAPELKLPLEAEGWHAVYIGFMGSKLRAKLSSDPAFVCRTRKGGPVEEVLFKVADLTGEELHIAQYHEPAPAECTVAWVKLVPLSAAEVAQLQADRADASTRRLAISIDGYSYIGAEGLCTRAQVLEDVEELRNSDFGTLYVCVGGADLLNYPSEHGNMPGVGPDGVQGVYSRPVDRQYAEAVTKMAEAGINPTQVYIEGARSMGMTVHASIRPAAWAYPWPLENVFISRFYADHPEWRCVDRDGTEVARMSFAVPEVRQHLVEVLREAVGFGADDVNISYNRGAPLVLYEEPFCRLFQERYGEDPRVLPEGDERVRALRVEIMTQFMREVRQMLDDEQARRGDGRRLGISAFVYANEADNLQFGIDVRGWVQAGLLDEVAPYAGAGGAKARDFDLQFFREACGERGVPWRPTMIGWRAPELDAMMQQVLDWYDAGASGVTFWDGNSLSTRTDSWAIVSRLGHIDELRRRAGEGVPAPTVYRPHRIGAFVMDGRYAPTWGF